MRADVERLARLAAEENSQQVNVAGSAKLKTPEEGATHKAESNSKAPEAQPEAKAEKTANPTDITLKFKIDEKTQDVTILILNRSTRQLVRTIPPEEMNKIEPGDLLELFA